MQGLLLEKAAGAVAAGRDHPAGAAGAAPPQPLPASTPLLPPQPLPAAGRAAAGLLPVGAAAAGLMPLDAASLLELVAAAVRGLPVEHGACLAERLQPAAST